jgi:hypothetical protein
MKRFFLCISIVFLFFAAFGESYEVVERTSTFGLIPILSDTNERTDGQYLPSLLAANKEGYAYIDYNFTKGGLIVPILENRSLVFAAWYENTPGKASAYGIKNLMNYFQPGGPDMPDFNHLMGFSAAGNISDSISAGLTFRYLMGRLFEENSLANTTNSHKINADRIEITPSVTFRTEKLFFDFGFALNYQWLTEKAVGTYQYDRVTTYDGNADFSLYARTGLKLSNIQDIVFSAGYGVLPLSEKVLDASGDAIRSIKLNRHFWSIKVATIIKPFEWVRIHPAVILLGSHRMTEQKELAPNNDEVTTDSNEQVSFLLTMGMDIIPVEWFSIKSGVLKRFDAYTDGTKTKETEVKQKDYYLDETFGAYLGNGFHWKGFSFISMINLDFFINGPYMMSGNSTVTNFAYIASVEYQW